MRVKKKVELVSEIFRIEKRNDFTIVRNGLLRDKTMSLKAKALLITMLSKPDDWDYTLNGLQSILLEGRDAIASGLKELEQHGYLIRRKIRDRNGRFTDVEYVIFELPTELVPDAAEPAAENPETENPEMVKPSSENPPVINKEINEDEGIWREIITENLESDIVREESGCDPGIVDDIVELMVDTVCSTRRYIRVGKEDKPAAAVKSRLLKLERRHLVRNIRAYLLTALYNSYFSECSGMAAQVQHDLYGKGGEAI